MLSLFMQALPQEPASRLSASHRGRRKEASCQGTSAVVVFVLEGICIMKDNISWLQKVAISQREMPASISGTVVTRGDLSWDTQSFCIWSLVQITTSLAGIESLDHLVTQMNSSRWTGALITVGALIDWRAKAEWKGRFTMEVWVPCSAQALRMENFDFSALSVCHAAQTKGTSKLRWKTMAFKWDWRSFPPWYPSYLASPYSALCFAGYPRALRASVLLSDT